MSSMRVDSALVQAPNRWFGRSPVITDGEEEGIKGFLVLKMYHLLYIPCWRWATVDASSRVVESTVLAL